MSDFDPYLQWLGIQPHEQPPDHYRLLGLRRFETDRVAIQSATDERMALVRINQIGPRAPFTQKLLNNLATAKLCLLNPYSKAEYDASLAREMTGTAQEADALLPVSVPGRLAASNSLTPAHLPASQWPQLASQQPSFQVLKARASEYDPHYLGWWLPILGMLATIVVGLIIWGAKTRLDRRTIPVEISPSPSAKSEGHSIAIVPDGSGTRESPSDSGLIMQEASGFVFFPMSAAALRGRATFESLDVGDFLVGWRNEDDLATWRFKILKLPSQGTFRVRVAYQAAGAAADAAYVLSLDGQEQTRDVRFYGRLVEDECYLAVKRAGQHTLTFSVRNLPATATFGLKLFELSIPR